MKELKVSIVTVSYNSAKTIERTIQSVKCQTYDNIEYVIVDGGSNDGTIEIIKKYADFISKWVSEPDKGIYDAMNKGINMASGDIIGIINSDDCLHDKDIIGKIVSYYNNSDNLFVFHGNRCYFNEDGTCSIDIPKSDPACIKRGPFIFHPTMFVPRVFYDRVGLFDLRYRIAADYDLILRLYLASCPFVYKNEIVTDMYAGGASDKKRYKGFVESLMIMIRLGVNPLLALFYFVKRCLGTILNNKK